MKTPLIAALMVLLYSPGFGQGTEAPKNKEALSNSNASVTVKDSVLFASIQKTVEKLTEELNVLNTRLKEKVGKEEAPKVLCARILLKPEPFVVVRKEENGQEISVPSDRMARYKPKKQQRKSKKSTDEGRYKMVYIEKVLIEIKDSKIERMWVKYRNNVYGNTKVKTSMAEKPDSNDKTNLSLQALSNGKIKLNLNTKTNPGEFIYLEEFLEYEDYFKTCGNINIVVELTNEKYEHAITK